MLSFKQQQQERRMQTTTTTTSTKCWWKQCAFNESSRKKGNSQTHELTKKNSLYLCTNEWTRNNYEKIKVFPSFFLHYYFVLMFYSFTSNDFRKKRRNNDDFSKTAEKHFKYNNTEYLVEHLNEYWKWFI